MTIAFCMIGAGILPMPFVYLLRRFQLLKVDLDIHQGSIRRNETTASTKEMIDQDDDVSASLHAHILLFNTHFQLSYYIISWMGIKRKDEEIFFFAPLLTHINNFAPHSFWLNSWRRNFFGNCDFWKTKSEAFKAKTLQIKAKKLVKCGQNLWSAVEVSCSCLRYSYKSF